MTDEARVAAIVLAAGQGTRMKSTLPKVLHHVAGEPMVNHVVAAAQRASAGHVVVVVGHGREHVEASLSKTFGNAVSFAHQAEQRGTGHAAGIGLTRIGDEIDLVFVLYGDTPLLLESDLQKLRDLLLNHSETQLAMLTCEVPDATGYGRIIRDVQGRATAIREHRDCSKEELEIREINPGVYCVRASFLRRAIPLLQSNNAQNELYLTDVVALAAQESLTANEGQAVRTQLADALTLEGINDRAQLYVAEERMLARIANKWRKAGVTIRAGAQVHSTVTLEEDVTIETGVVLRGKTTIGRGATIDVGCVLTDTTVAAGAHIKPYSVATSSSIGEGAQVGPFSHLRPGSELEAQVHVGNFVETKATVMRKGSKANHLAYLGDGDVGERANIGAGTIFCNYDGFKKHRTNIGAEAFIGSDSQLVAPITIGNGAYVATGTTVTRDVPADGLAIGRTKQENKEGYASRLRSRLKARSTTKE